MELKSSFIFFFLLSRLLALPSISTGRSEVVVVVDSEIYEIDYRGPETHSSAMPPPGRSHGRPFLINQNAISSPKSPNAKKIHG